MDQPPGAPLSFFEFQYLPLFGEVNSVKIHNYKYG